MGEYVWKNYADVNEEQTRLGSALYQLGVKPGDRIIIMSETRAEWLTTALAGFRYKFTGILFSFFRRKICINKFLLCSVVTLYPTLNTEGTVFGVNEVEAEVLFTSQDIALEKLLVHLLIYLVFQKLYIYEMKPLVATYIETYSPVYQIANDGLLSFPTSVTWTNQYGTIPEDIPEKLSTLTVFRIAGNGQREKYRFMKLLYHLILIRFFNFSSGGTSGTTQSCRYRHDYVHEWHDWCAKRYWRQNDLFIL